VAVDTKKLRELAQELGYWPATTDTEDIARHRRLNAALDRAPSMEQVAAKNRHHDVARERQAAKDRAVEDLRDLY
jgi:hypothetical protein